MKAGDSAASDRRWAEHSCGGAVVGDVSEDIGELGVAGAQGRAIGQGVVPRADGRTGNRGDAIAAGSRQAADGEGDLKKGRGVLCAGVDAKYAWIEAHIDSYPIRLTCELLGVSPSGFYAARSWLPSARAVEQAQIVTEIRRAQSRHRVAMAVGG